MPPEASADEAPVRAPIRKRIAPALLLAAVGVGGALMWRHSPQERELELRLHTPGDVTAVEVTWVDEHGEALRHSRLTFASAAPERLAMPVSLPDGDYNLFVRVARGAAASDSTHRIRFDDEVDRSTVFAR